MRNIWSTKRKRKNKNRIFFNSLLQTTLNPYLQALFLQTWKFQNQKFAKNGQKNFNGWIWEKRKVPNLKNTSIIPSVNADYKRLEKGKNEKHWSTKRKRKNKNRIFFNSLLQTTLNPYLQALFLKTWKFQNQKFGKNEHKIFNDWIWEKRKVPNLKNTSTIPSINDDYKRLEKGKKWEAFEAYKEILKIESFLIPFYQQP